MQRTILQAILCRGWPAIVALMALLASGCASRRASEAAQQTVPSTPGSGLDLARVMCLGDWIGIWRVKGVAPVDAAIRVDKYYGLLTQLRVYPYAAGQYLRQEWAEPEDATEFFSACPEEEGTTMFADWLFDPEDPRPLGDTPVVTITTTEICRDWPPWPFPFRFAYEHRLANGERLLMLTHPRDQVTITLVKTSDMPGATLRSPSVIKYFIRTDPQKVFHDTEKAYEQWLCARQ